MSIFKCFSSKTKPDDAKKNLKPVSNKSGKSNLDSNADDVSNFSSSQASNFNNIHRNTNNDKRMNDNSIDDEV